jgi:hypothetical protein
VECREIDSGIVARIKKACANTAIIILCVARSSHSNTYSRKDKMLYTVHRQ